MITVFEIPRRVWWGKPWCCLSSYFCGCAGVWLLPFLAAPNYFLAHPLFVPFTSVAIFGGIVGVER